MEGIGETAIRCNTCGADVTPFNFTNGYTIFFDPNHTVGVTLPKQAAETIAHDAKAFASLPDNAAQNPILTFAPHDSGFMCSQEMKTICEYLTTFN